MIHLAQNSRLEVLQPQETLANQTRYVTHKLFKNYFKSPDLCYSSDSFSSLWYRSLLRSTCWISDSAEYLPWTGGTKILNKTEVCIIVKQHVEYIWYKSKCCKMEICYCYQSASLVSSILHPDLMVTSL